MSRATAKFKAALPKSHKYVSMAVARTPAGQVIPLKIIDGVVNADVTAQYRRGGQLVFVDPSGTLAPLDDSGAMAPIGTEVQLFRGIDYRDGTPPEVYSLGVFMLSITSMNESVGTAGGNYGTGTGTGAPSAGAGAPTGGIQFGCQIYDRSRKVSRDKFTSVYTIAAGTNVITAIKKVIQRTFPDAQYDSISTSQTTPAILTYDVQTDPWTVCQDLATSIGCDIYFDTDGDVVISPPADIDRISASEFDYDVDQSGSGCMEINLTYTDDPGYNGVVVTGASVASTSPPVRAVAWDDEPTSPTYYKGPYGRVPMFVDDTTITTTAAAQASANSLLKAQLGFAQQVALTTVPNPSYEIGDIIYVKRQRLGIASLFTITSFTVPLKDSAAQVITANQNRTALVD